MPSARHVASCFLDACHVFARGVCGRAQPTLYVALGRDVFEDEVTFLGLFADRELAQACGRRAARQVQADGPQLDVQVFPADVHTDPASYHPSIYVD